MSPSSVGKVTVTACSDLSLYKKVGLTNYLLPLSFTFSSSSSLMISLPSDVTLKPCSTLALFLRAGLVAKKNSKNHVNKYLYRIQYIFCESKLLPSTLWETLGSRKLSGSSSSPSLSQAFPFCDLPAFFRVLPVFPSSSDKSLSDSARMSSILERRGWKVFK